MLVFVIHPMIPRWREYCKIVMNVICLVKVFIFRLHKTLDLQSGCTKFKLEWVDLFLCCIWSVLRSASSLTILAISFSFSYMFKIKSSLLSSEFSWEIVPINLSFGSLELSFCSYLLGFCDVLPLYINPLTSVLPVTACD